MEDYDIAIIGRGVIGSLAALAGHKANLRILLVGPKEDLITKKMDSSRSYALSPSSVDFIKKVAFDNSIELNHQNISIMEIVNNGGRIKLLAEDANKKYLAKIVSHKTLMSYVSISETIKNIHQCENKPYSLEYENTSGGERAVLTFKNGKNFFQTRSKLIIGADGASSWVRQKAGIFWGRKGYNQKAIIADIIPEKEHKGVACQWFYKDGILALLPATNGSLSMVWSVSYAFADKVMSESQDIFLGHLNKISQSRFGPLRLSNKPTSVDLSMTLADSFYGRRIALLGDSAHTVHPLAGLGLNLGIYDLIALIQHGGWITENHESLFDPGSKKKLIDYNQHRVKRIPKVQFSLDSLVGLFGLPNAFANSIRNLGMNYADKFPLVKRSIIRHAHTIF